MKKDIGLYIHIPFCKSKCYYCDFISFSKKEELIENYIEAVIKEIKHVNLSKYNIKTVYIGGGTPSILDGKFIIQILEEIIPYTSQDAEITIEINPGTASKEKLQTYKNIGINRLSIGLQSTENILLKEIGRIHKYKDFLKVYNQARKLDFCNINIDLMLGLPNQSLELLEKSLREAIDLNPEHISIYSLILEEHTKLYNMVKEGKLKLPEEKTERQMYWKTKNILQNNGYTHYEISNFAKPNNKSRHNLDCWEQKEYLGIGAAAHSYLDETRFSNTENLENYIKNINNNKFTKNITIHEKQTKQDKEKEFMLLGLRKIAGINIKDFQNKFAENPLLLYNTEINKLIDCELIEIDGEYIKLTDKGLDFANQVWQEFV